MRISSLLLSAVVATQTTITPPENKYTPAQDVELGQKAAAEARQQLPIMRDDAVSSYVEEVGRRLVSAIPPDLRHPEFRYTFEVVNVREINAFALPGGPMFVNRGMIEAAHTEGEVAGVMAHELSHVALRHGTAQATKATPYEIGQVAGAIFGAIVGGTWGRVIAQGTQFGLGAAFLRFSREYEQQADLEGSHIMARAGYDPRALAHMFETIEKETQSSGGGGPQWMSSHPNPGNRTQYITKEAEMLTIAKAADSAEFVPMKAAFASLPAAKSMADLAHAKQQPSGSQGLQSSQSTGVPGQPVPRPSSQYRNISGGKIFTASVPADWTPLASKSSIRVVPQNGYGEVNGQTVFSHGIEFGVSPAGSRDLQEATKAWLNAVAQGNPELRLAGAQQALKMSQRSAIATPLVNPSPLGGQERVVAYTTFLVDGNLFYYLTVVPESDAAAFQETFRRVGESIKLT